MSDRNAGTVGEHDRQVNEPAQDSVDDSVDDSAGSRADRCDEMFTVGAPDIGIAGVAVLRSTISARDELDVTESELRHDALTWRIGAVPTGEDEVPLVLLGDLVSTLDGWFIGVSVYAQVAYRPGARVPDLDDASTLNEVSKSLGPWASNVLYDVASVVARQLVATTLRCEVDIPWETPVPIIALVSGAEG